MMLNSTNTPANVQSKLMCGRRLNLLATNGGGIRDLSSLQILKQILEGVVCEKNLANLRSHVSTPT